MCLIMLIYQQNHLWYVCFYLSAIYHSPFTFHSHFHILVTLIVLFHLHIFIFFICTRTFWHLELRSMRRCEEGVAKNSFSTFFSMTNNNMFVLKLVVSPFVDRIQIPNLYSIYKKLNFIYSSTRTTKKSFLWP